MRLENRSEHVDADLQVSQRSPERGGEIIKKWTGSLRVSFLKQNFFAKCIFWISHGGTPQEHISKRIHTTRLAELDSPAAA